MNSRPGGSGDDVGTREVGWALNYKFSPHPDAQWRGGAAVRRCGGADRSPRRAQRSRPFNDSVCSVTGRIGPLTLCRVLLRTMTSAIGRHGTTLFQEVERELLIEAGKSRQARLSGRRAESGGGISQSDRHGEVVPRPGEQWIYFIRLHEQFPGSVTSGPTVMLHNLPARPDCTDSGYQTNQSVAATVKSVTVSSVLSTDGIEPRARPCPGRGHPWHRRRPCG
jgi:hypothetical protein